jgi:hypothetical protein
MHSPMRLTDGAGRLVAGRCNAISFQRGRVGTPCRYSVRALSWRPVTLPPPGITASDKLVAGQRLQRHSWPARAVHQWRFDLGAIAAMARST